MTNVLYSDKFKKWEEEQGLEIHYGYKSEELDGIHCCKNCQRVAIKDCVIPERFRFWDFKSTICSYYSLDVEKIEE